MRVSDAIQDYLLAGMADGLSEATLTWRKSYLKNFGEKMGHMDLNQVTTRHIREYLVNLRSAEVRYQDAPQKPPQKGGLARATLANYTRVLHTFFKFCEGEYALSTNPMVGIKRPKPIRAEIKKVTLEDFQRLLEACETGRAGARDKALLMVLAETGARVGGLLGLNIADLDLDAGRAYVTEKGRKARLVYFGELTAYALRAYLEKRGDDNPAVFINLKTGGRLTYAGVVLVLKRLQKRAGLTGRYNPHNFRHNFATNWLRKGGSLATLSLILGHSQVTTTMGYYAHLDDSDLQAAHLQYGRIENNRK